MNYNHCVTQAELDEFSPKSDIDVVFDIGAKDNGIAMTKYLQYEHWDNDAEIRSLLPDFSFKDLGSRNVFCTRVNE